VQGGCRPAINRHVFKLLDKKRSLPPGNDATGDRTRIMSLLRINDQRERSYVRLSFCWKRSTCSQVLFIALWSCVVGGEEPRRSEAVVHFTEIRGARLDVVVGIKGIDAQFVANAQFNPRSRHNLHEAKSSLWRDCSVICPALKLHDGANPMLRNRKSSGRLTYEGCKGFNARCARRMRYRNGRRDICQGVEWQHGRHKGGKTRRCPKKPEGCHRAHGRQGYCALAPASRPPWTVAARDGRREPDRDEGIVPQPIEQRNDRLMSQENHDHSSQVHTGSALPMTEEFGTNPK